MSLRCWARRIACAALFVPVAASAAPWQSETASAAPHAMVATEQRYASRVGVRVLESGGNAVDAAVAVAYALAVVDPCCGNVGGGGFMVLRMHDGRERFIDFREKAPLRATRDMYLDARGNPVAERSQKGWLAIGVPGTVLGMETARREYGTMSRERLMAPAIALARAGFVVGADDLPPFLGSEQELSGGPYDFAHQANVAVVFLRGGALPKPASRLVQPQLARTLELIARDGAGAFYRGPIARAIVNASSANGGILSMADFAAYRVEESAPLHCTYAGYDVASAPPPSSGGVTLCEILNILAPYPLAAWGWHGPDETHYLVEAERRAYADRNAYLGDPDFVTDPVAQLLDPAYAARLRATIDARRATPSSQVRPGLDVAIHENGETTHYSIVDEAGNAVAVTYTLNDWFGAGVIAGDTGFFLNDEMDDFAAKAGTANMYGLVQGARNGVEPGKRPLSSMAPTVVTKDGKLVMVTGSPGGGRIITIALETILNALVFGMNAQQAVDAPRVHMQWLPDEVQYEPGALTPETMDALRANGYRFRMLDPWGVAQVILVDPVTGTRYGGSARSRPGGAALGY